MNDQPPITDSGSPGVGVKPPSSGRGARAVAAARVTYRRSDVRKPGWQQKNPDLVKALSEGRALCVGD